jgi:hypothetical protein
MADERTPAPDSGPAGAPAGRNPIVVEGESTEVRAAEGEPSPSEAPANFASTDAPQAPADTAPPEAPAYYASTEAPADSAPTEAPPEPAAAAPFPASADPSPRERTSGGAFVWGLCGALVGAAVALGAAWFFEPPGDSSQDLAARLSALEARAAAPSSEEAKLETRIDGVEAAQASFAKATALDAIDKRLAKLESAPVKPEIVAAALAEARAARDEAAKALAQANAAAQGNGKPAPAAPDPRIAEIKADEAAQGARIDKLEAALGDRTGKIEAALGGRIDKLETSLGDRIGQIEAALGGRIDKLETTLGDRIGKIEGALAAPKTETRVPPTEVAPKSDPAAQAIAALALEQRLHAGEPFAAEWAALSRLGADGAALATLKPYSDTGAPTAAALAASFAKIAPSLLAADNPETGDGVVDKMLDHMRKLVRVRAVGEVAGDDPAALVSQIEAALARGQTASALGIYARLPEAARKAGADWAKTADARVAADAAAQSLRENAIGRLAAARN